MLNSVGSATPLRPESGVAADFSPRGDSRASGVPKQTDQRTRDAAASLVSQMFFVPILQQMREMPFGKEFGHGGRGEEVFGEQLDQQLADLMARGDRSGLVDQVARQISRERAGSVKS